MLTKCDHLLTFGEGQVKQENLSGRWGGGGITHFPADLAGHEVLSKGGFGLLSSSVYEDLINTHTSLIISFKKIIVVGLPMIEFLGGKPRQ